MEALVSMVDTSSFNPQAKAGETGEAGRQAAPPGRLGFPARHRAAPAADDARWEQVLARDPSAAFVYAVRTTGIFCRPTCASRRPSRANVVFFPDAAAASAAGFRACLRCQPTRQPAEAALVERLAAYLVEQRDRNVSLAELGSLAGCAPTTVQRLFVRVLGMSPRAWANARRAEAYRDLLQPGATPPGNAAGERITDAIYAAGFSGPSRAHQAAPLGMQARRYRAQGAGERIGYTLADAPALGRMLVAATERGVCAVLLGDEDGALTAELAHRFPRAQLAADASLAPHVSAVLAALGAQPGAHALPLDLRGTAFQARVWQALQTIPRGTTCSYAELAAAVGAPRAVRAVAAACGQNPAAIVVPCHRVLGANGKLTGYRWGVHRKQALLTLEASALAAGRNTHAAKE